MCNIYLVNNCRGKFWYQSQVRNVISLSQNHRVFEFSQRMYMSRARCRRNRLRRPLPFPSVVNCHVHRVTHKCFIQTAVLKWLRDYDIKKEEVLMGFRAAFINVSKCKAESSLPLASYEFWQRRCCLLQKISFFHLQRKI